MSLAEALASDRVDPDSLDAVEMVMLLEGTFRLTIPDDDFERLRTVRDVIAYLVQRGIEPPSNGNG